MKRWSNDEVQFLIKNFPIKDIGFCCDELNRSEKQIREKVFKLGIKKERNTSGENNPNWKGGSIDKVCEICGVSYVVKRPQAKSRFCSLQCWGIGQRKPNKHIIDKTEVPTKNPLKYTKNTCLVCNTEYEVRICKAHSSRTCSSECSLKYRSIISSGEKNTNWKGGLSRAPYPYNWASISKSIIERDGAICMNPNCGSNDERITVHHIDYDKMNCNPVNLIAVCATCNSIANFGRQQWHVYYMDVQKERGITSIDESIPKAQIIKDHEARKGERHPLSKLTQQDIYEIRSYLSIFNLRGAQRKIASLFGVSEASISKIFNGKSWT